MFSGVKLSNATYLAIAQNLTLAIAGAYFIEVLVYKALHFWVPLRVGRKLTSSESYFHVPNVIVEQTHQVFLVLLEPKIALKLRV